MLGSVAFLTLLGLVRPARDLSGTIQDQEFAATGAHVYQRVQNDERLTAGERRVVRLQIYSGTERFPQQTVVLTMDIPKAKELGNRELKVGVGDQTRFDGTIRQAVVVDGEGPKPLTLEKCRVELLKRQGDLLTFRIEAAGPAFQIKGKGKATLEQI